MKRIALALPFLLVAADASAISRYDIGSLRCDKVQAILQSEGAAILRYRSPQNGLTLYDRFVSGRNFCRRTQDVDRVGLPTSDPHRARFSNALRATAAALADSSEGARTIHDGR